MVAVPLLLFVNETPVPASDVGVQDPKAAFVMTIEAPVGLPVVVTVKVPAVPVVKVVELALVIVGAIKVVPENCAVAAPLVQTVLTVK
jgi:hypothetical protein